VLVDRWVVRSARETKLEASEQFPLFDSDINYHPVLPGCWPTWIDLERLSNRHFRLRVVPLQAKSCVCSHPKNVGVELTVIPQHG
jgi:hypothetical protein